MRPLPTTNTPAPAPAKTTVTVAAAQTLELGALASPSPAPNRRAANCPVQTAYPWLLLASTALAAVFCGLYLTKPVIVTGGNPGPAANSPAPVLASTTSAKPKPAESMMPRSESLPGDSSKPEAADPRRLAQASADGESTYEETNLRVQHVLNAQGPDGEDLGKIMLQVPVMYRSRSLRWTPDEITRARELMVRIGNYQEASRMIREEGQTLLAEWNQLVGGSIPTTVLRADSPSLSTIARPEDHENLDSTQAIEIQNR